MINRCVGCYYHDSKENVCNHGSPIFIDDICTDYQDNEFVKQIRAETIAEISKEMRLLYGNEYEKKIRAEVIEEYKKEMHDMIEGDEEFTDWQKYEILECNELVAEQLKEQI